MRRGRLYPVFRGVYAVGRPQLTQRGRWMAAVLACGDDALLSHEAAARLWALRSSPFTAIEVTVSPARDPRPPGVVVHRRRLPAADLTTRHAIPVTTPAHTLLDLAPGLAKPQLERAVNEADRLDLIDPENLREWLELRRGAPGVAILRALLDRHTFTLTDSELERRFLLIVRRAGLPAPLTQQRVNGYRVDFFWPKLGLVVETDGLRYHRTPAQQAHDRERDQAHAAAGLTALRFTHAQVADEPRRIVENLRVVAGRLGAIGDTPSVRA